jgi:hypothetical protein
VLSDDRSQISFERPGYAVAAVNADEAAAIGVEEVNLSMPAGLPDLVNLEAGRAKHGDSVSERRAHQTVLPLTCSAISAASARW